MPSISVTLQKDVPSNVPLTSLLSNMDWTAWRRTKERMDGGEEWFTSGVGTKKVARHEINAENVTPCVLPVLFWSPCLWCPALPVPVIVCPVPDCSFTSPAGSHSSDSCGIASPALIVYTCVSLTTPCSGPDCLLYLPCVASSSSSSSSCDFLQVKCFSTSPRLLCFPPESLPLPSETFANVTEKQQKNKSNVAGRRETGRVASVVIIRAPGGPFGGDGKQDAILYSIHVWQRRGLCFPHTHTLTFTRSHKHVAAERGGGVCVCGSSPVTAACSQGGRRFRSSSSCRRSVFVLAPN